MAVGAHPSGEGGHGGDERRRVPPRVRRARAGEAAPPCDQGTDRHEQGGCEPEEHLRCEGQNVPARDGDDTGRHDGRERAFRQRIRGAVEKPHDLELDRSEPAAAVPRDPAIRHGVPVIRAYE